MLGSAAHALSTWSPTMGSNTPPEAYAVRGPGFAKRGNQEQKSHRRAPRARTLAHDSSRARATLTDATRSSVSAATASVRALRSSPRLNQACLGSVGIHRRAQTPCSKRGKQVQAKHATTPSLQQSTPLGRDTGANTAKAARAPATKLADLDCLTQPPP